MEQPNHWKILEAAPIADEASSSEHFTAFVNNFVQKDRRERWLHLLLKRPSQIYSDSRKLHDHLNWSKCSQFKEENLINQKSKGIYYRFIDEPVILTVADAFAVGRGKDGIFSIVPGELAFYFFHEDEIVLCKI